MPNYSQQMQSIFQQYQREVSSSPADLRDVARWALDNDLWHPKPSDVMARFASDMATALREEYRTDKSGRRYRAKHAVRTTRNGKQMSFWADIDLAPRSHIEKAFSQRRKQIVGDCHQLKLDVDHYNDEKPNEEPIQFIMDFTEDVEEMLILEGVESKAA